MRRFVVLGVLLGLLALPGTAAANGPRFLGEARVPTGTQFQGTTIGGLSSITYDERRGVYYAISDDQANVRFYTVGIDVRHGPPSVQFRDVTGLPYASGSIDPEGLVLTRERELILTSEGFPATGVDPFVHRHALDGSFLGALPVPDAFRVTADASAGVRPNLGFESAGALGPYVYTAAENAVYQDGAAATIAGGSPARIVRWKSGRLDRQWIYQTDRVAEPPVPATAFSVNGIVELLPLTPSLLIAMERSFSVGAPDTGNTIKLYAVALVGHRAYKTLLFDLDRLGIPLDNVEGMTFGPRLRDGRQTLVLVSDNNFAATQFTQFLVFAI
jgi:3-phytase/alkaline phosphatase D